MTSTNDPVTDPQSIILRRYCAEAEAQIRTAKDAEEATAIAERVCADFRKECESSLILTATRVYLDGIIAGLFGNDNEQTN